MWVCWDCLAGICAKKPKLPLNGLASDIWGGRFRPCLNGASEATKTLASLGRYCMKQVCFGRGEPDMQQKGIAGNTIFFAQPHGSDSQYVAAAGV